MTQTDGIWTKPGQYVLANGLNMYYEECGSGEPLILLHGGGGTGRMWQPLLSHFVSHFRVIAPDNRAHGKTDNPTGELSYGLMADDLAAFIPALGLTKPLVCGYSDGGQIALEIGIRHPGLTRALVVGAASCRTTESSLAGLKALGLEGPGVVDFEQLQRESPLWAGILRTEHARADIRGCRNLGCPSLPTSHLAATCTSPSHPAPPS